MRDSAQQIEDAQLLRRVTSATIHIGLLLLLLGLCLRIVLPFVIPVAWAMVLAVALAPLHSRLCGWFGGRNKLAAALLVVAALGILLIPTWIFIGSLIEGATKLAASLEQGTLTIPPPSESVAEWPLVGEKVHEVWTMAAEDSVAAAQQFAPQLTALAGKLMSAIAGLGMGVLGFAFAVLIAGVFLAISGKSQGVAEAIGLRLLGERGRELVATVVATIRSVVEGVLGVAAIQALLVGVGLVLAGVPGAGLWTLLVLIFGIAQLPPLLVTGPIIAYVFSQESTSVAVIFTIWTVLASSADTFLKPIFLGRGVKSPMPVILVGAIGGMMAFGILGLFLGAVVLAVFHELFMAWLKAEDGQEGEETIATP